MYVSAVNLDVPADLTIGHTVPLVGAITKVTLNGEDVPFKVRLTNRAATVPRGSGPGWPSR